MVSDNGNNESERQITPKWLPPDLAAQYVSVNIDTVYGWINSGRLKASDIVEGSRTRWRVRVSDLDDFMDDTDRSHLLIRVTRTAFCVG